MVKEEQNEPHEASSGESENPDDSNTADDSTAQNYLLLPPSTARSLDLLGASAGESLRNINQMLAPFAKQMAITRALWLRNLGPLFEGVLSGQGVFSAPESEPSSYSTEMKSASSYFERDEIEIESFDRLNAAISGLVSKHPDIPLVWRGQQDSSWGVHSSLFRALAELNGVKPPSSKPRPRGTQNYPDEDQMNAAEAALLRTARDEWRLDGSPALEMLARLQHFGAPTRLLDVTRNPYIAAWFAVERDDRLEEKDARLFAIGTRPKRRQGDDQIPDSTIRLDELGSLRDPFWHLLSTTEERRGADWGTGSKRRLWVPPTYEQRMVAQNAGFIVDGVPIITAKTAPYFKKDSGSEYWKRADLLAAASIYMKTAKPTVAVRPNQPNFAPTFSFRITHEAKDQIRKVLETRFSYNRQTIYPDIEALAGYLKKNLGEILTSAES